MIADLFGKGADEVAGDVYALRNGALAVTPWRAVLMALGVVSAGCAVLMTQVTPGWPYAVVIALASVFGAATLGWNGVYIAELARVAPAGKVAMATGASLSCAYFGAVTAPPAFAWIVSTAGGYTAGYLLLALLAVAGVASLWHRR